MKKHLIWIPVILWMCVIFGFSAQPAAQSSELSSGVVKEVLTVVYPEYRNLPPVEQESIAEPYHVIVRKCAHFGVYLVLGVLVMLAFSVYSDKRKFILISIAVCACYAVFDELHQAFVAGRACAAFDMLLDTAGAACGTLLFFVIKKKVKSAKEQENN